MSTKPKRLTAEDCALEAAAEMGWEAAKSAGLSDGQAEARSEMAVDAEKERRARTKKGSAEK